MTQGPSPPWTEEQVARLNEYQACDWVHPFTCANDGNDVLIAKTDGWHCPKCEYQQHWAHDFMFNGAPRRPPEFFR